MKIQCRYCNNYMNDTDDICPSCGAKNADVKRAVSSQPKTIEELQKWYADRGLPDYETTRFFIGENYTKPRAFGIYKDTGNGKFIVYKNKDSGQRAIRYEGSDEAYAVNEIFQRLKQEIVEQKMNNAKKSLSAATMQGTRSNSAAPTTRSSGRSVGSSYSKPTKKKKKSFFLSTLFKFLLMVFAPIIFLVLLGFIIIAVEDEPKQGYYKYNGNTYYYSTQDYNSDNLNWYLYDEDNWLSPIKKADMPQEMQKNKTAKSYFLRDSWDSSLPCDDFTDSVYYADMQKGFNTSSGYYKSDDDYYYYHLGTAYDSGWYYYSEDDEWESADYSDIPDELYHPSLVEDFYYTPTWDASTQLTDFTDSSAYSDYLSETASQRSYSYSNDDDSYGDDDYDWGWDNDDDDDYDWSWDDDSDYDWSWDSNSSDWDSDW